METSTEINISDSYSFGNVTYVAETFDTPFTSTHTRRLFITAYVIVFATCITGNILVLFAIGRSQRLRSMTNFFLANLAVADLCVGVFCVLPNLSTFLSPTWILGRVMCKIYYYIWNVSYTASILILTVIAVERYVAILHPLKARHFMTPRKLIAIQLAIWVLAISYSIPYLVLYDTIQFPMLNIEFCYFDAPSLPGLKGLSIANLIMWYVIPLALIGLIYYKIGKALWNTTVVSALRLQSCGETKKGSVHSFSTRSQRATPMTSGSKRSSYEGPEESNRSQNDPQTSCNSDRDQYYKTGNTLTVVNRNGTLTLVYGFQLRPMRPELGCCTPGSSRDNSTDDGSQSSPVDNRGWYDQLCFVSPKKPLVRYRQAHIESSRKVARARKKVVRLLTAIVISFAICVFPHHLKVLNHYWNIFSLPHAIDVYMSPCSFIILYLNSALNPILYALFSQNFRKSFKETLPCIRKRPKKHTSPVVIKSN